MSKENFKNDIIPQLSPITATKNENIKRSAMLIQRISGRGTDFQRQELYE
jgi:hypothetical protein